MKLIVFSGLPGAGKTALAEATGRTLGIPVFAKDWLGATLLRCELEPANPEKPLGSAGYQLLTTLAERQLTFGQSVIIDSVASTVTIRATWKKLATRYNADWRIVECVCTDEALHCARLVSRQRNIPGWHELTWQDVEHVRSYFAPWREPHLIIDTVSPLEHNLGTILAYL
jgi:predicted kinase